MSDSVTFSKFEFYEGLFLLVPPKVRISFYAQQKRTVLFCSQFIKKYYKSLKDQKILIVGAGISGSMAYICLKEAGFENVFIVEAHSEPIAMQSFATHRHAHPTYNEWPLSDTELTATTDLPFMNWYADQASSVIQQMKQDPYYQFYFRGDNSQNQLFDTKVERVEKNLRDCADEPFTVQMKSEENQTAPTMDFHKVIFAVGPGTELHLDGSYADSYWYPDWVERLTSNYLTHGNKRRFVSGCGDGAYIDFLRLLRTDEIKSERENRKIAIDIHKDNIALFFISLFREARFRSFEEISNVGAPLSDLESRIQNAYKQTGDRWITEIKTVLQNIEQELVDKIMSLFKKGEILKRTFLVGDAKCWENENASPVNLLIVKLLQISNPNEMSDFYCRGLVLPVASSVSINAEEVKKIANKFESVFDEAPNKKSDEKLGLRSIKLGTYHLVTTNDDRFEALSKNDIHIARNGVSDPLVTILAKDFLGTAIEPRPTGYLGKLEELKSAEEYVNYLKHAKREYEEAKASVEALENGTVGSGIDVNHDKKRYELAKAFVDRYFKEGDVAKSGNAWLVELDDFEDNKHVYQKTGGLETTLFGHSISYKNKGITFASKQNSGRANPW